MDFVKPNGGKHAKRRRRYTLHTIKTSACLLEIKKLTHSQLKKANAPKGYINLFRNAKNGSPCFTYGTKVHRVCFHGKIQTINLFPFQPRTIALSIGPSEGWPDATLNAAAAMAMENWAFVRQLPL